MVHGKEGTLRRQLRKLEDRLVDAFAGSGQSIEISSSFSLEGNNSFIRLRYF